MSVKTTPAFLLVSEGGRIAEKMRTANEFDEAEERTGAWRIGWRARRGWERGPRFIQGAGRCAFPGQRSAELETIGRAGTVWVGTMCVVQLSL